MLRGDADLPFLPRLAPAADGVFRVHAHQGDVMRTSDPLVRYRELWKQKPVLQVVYDDFYDRLAAACVPGLTIEIGGGIGNLKTRLADVVATDIQPAPWLDCVADAQRLPF